MAPTRPRRILVIGDLEATRLACELLSKSGGAVDHLLAPTDRDVTEALARRVDTVVIIVHSDIHALRYALLAEHSQAKIAIITTVFDATVAAQLAATVPNCVATSPADIAVPSILAALLDDDAVALRDLRGVPALVHYDAESDTVMHTPWSSRRGKLAAAEKYIPRWYGGSPGLMLAGLAGLAVILVTDWILSVLLLHQSMVSGLYAATRTVTTVGPADADVHHAPAWYLLVAIVFMLAALVFTGTFVAGLVDWLMSARSVRLFGRLAIPRRDHVVVSGLGQVGLRTCLALNQLNIPVVAIERNPAAENLRLARDAGIPVLIGHAEDRTTLNRVHLSRSLALAALGSDELDNVTVVISASAVAPHLRLVLRAGENPVVAETRSLFRIGRVINVSAQTAMSALLNTSHIRPAFTFGQDGTSFAATETQQGTVLVSRRPSRCDCGRRAEGATT